MKGITFLTATVLVVVLGAPGGVQAAGGIDRDGPFCPKRSLDLRAGERFDASRLEGKPLRRAEQMARRHDCVVRVVRLDGEPQIVTDDYNTGRINVAVRDGVVKRVVGIF